MTGNFSFLTESFFVHSRDYLARELPHSQKWRTYSHADLTFSQKHCQVSVCVTVIEGYLRAANGSRNKLKIIYHNITSQHLIKKKICELLIPVLTDFRFFRVIFFHVGHCDFCFTLSYE